jgi:alpha-1,3-glucan synthase
MTWYGVCISKQFRADMFSSALVIPKLREIEYPQSEPSDAIVVSICDYCFRIEVSLLRVDNITYVLLDAPIFQIRKKSEPYPRE